MENFIISGFSDEIDSDIEKQFSHLQRLGIHYFEPRGINGKNIAELSSKEVKNLKAQMDAYGIQASSIGSPIGKINITDPFAPHVETLKNIMETANILGTKNIRIFSFYIPKNKTHDEFRSAVIDRMQQMTALAESNELILLHENEKGIYGDTAVRCLDLLKTISSPALRAVFDPANFVQCGQQVFPAAYESLRPYIAYIHIKDAKKDGQVVPAGMGDAEIEKLLTTLKEESYQGFLSLEPHLGNFVGFSALENNSETKTEASTPEKFTLAYESLIKIIERVTKK